MEDVFIAFASFGSGGKKLREITTTNYLKMLKASSIIDKHYTSAEAEILFAKGVSKTMPYEKFQEALESIAAAKKVTTDSLVEAIIASGGPSASPGKTAAAKSNVVDRLTDTHGYTGSHKERFDETGKGKGLAGRESVAKGPGALPTKGLNPGTVRDLSELTDRTPSDVRGVKIDEDAPAQAPRKSATTVVSSPKAENLEELFYRFCSITGGSSHKEMDGNKFAKLCRDCGLIGKKLTATDVDIIFAKCKDKSVRKIDMPHFKKALKLIAEHMKLSVEEVEQMMMSAGRPKLVGTAADGAHIVDKLTDTQGYTGAHKERFDESGKGLGLEGRVQHTGVAELSDLTDRSEADVRGTPLRKNLHS